VLHRDAAIPDEWHRGEVRHQGAGIGLSVVAQGRVELGGLRPEASAHRGGEARDGPAALLLDRHPDEAELLAAPQQPGVGHHVLTDGGGQVAHLHAAGVPRAGLRAQRGARDGLAPDGAERGGAAPVQRLAGVRVLVAAGQPQAGARLVQALEADAEKAAVGGVLHPASNVVHDASVPLWQRTGWAATSSNPSSGGPTASARPVLAPVLEEARDPRDGRPLLR